MLGYHQRRRLLYGLLILGSVVTFYRIFSMKSAKQRKEEIIDTQHHIKMIIPQDPGLEVIYNRPSNIKLIQKYLYCVMPCNSGIFYHV